MNNGELFKNTAHKITVEIKTERRVYLAVVGDTLAPREYESAKRNRPIVFLGEAPADPVAPDMTRYFFAYADEKDGKTRVMQRHSLVSGYVLTSRPLNEPKPSRKTGVVELQERIDALEQRIVRLQGDLELVLDTITQKLKK